MIEYKREFQIEAGPVDALRICREIRSQGRLLAALEARRPARDIDLAARAFDNSVGEVLVAVRKMAEAATMERTVQSVRGHQAREEGGTLERRVRTLPRRYPLHRDPRL